MDFEISKQIAAAPDTVWSDGREGGARATRALRFVGVFGGVLRRLMRTLTERYLRFAADGLKRRSEELART